MLYVLHQIAETTYFSSLDPSTASIIHLTPIPNYIGYGQSTFDENDQIYIVNNGNDLIIINVVKGVIVNDLPNANLNDLVFDNLARKLYGISSGWQFDSVSLSTGNLNLISNLPPLSLPSPMHIQLMKSLVNLFSSEPSPLRCLYLELSLCT